MAKSRVLVNVFHPDIKQSRGNRILADSLKGAGNITLRFLYEEYPDFKIDVAREQALLEEHDLIVHQHPMYWYSAPALSQQWFCDVLTKGWAFPPGMGEALKGKHWLQVVTVGGPERYYHSGGWVNYTADELLRPFQATVAICSMTWATPKVLYDILDPESAEVKYAGLDALTDEEIASYGAEYRRFLEEFDTLP